VSNIQRGISYPHYTKETLEVINFCTKGHLTPEQTMYTFRTPILEKKPLIFNQDIKNDFESSDIFIIEIASKIAYQYRDIYVHHIAKEEPYNTPIKNQIIEIYQTKEEIENDIYLIKIMLNKPLIIVSHIATYTRGNRYILTEWLEEICKKNKICFLNPAKELLKMGYNRLSDLLITEPVLSHYNSTGHQIIKGIYQDFIQKL
jgi:hypothetical protein